MWAALILGLLALGFVGWRIWMARRSAIPQIESNLASDLRRHMMGQMNGQMDGRQEENAHRERGPQPQATPAPEHTRSPMPEAHAQSNPAPAKPAPAKPSTQAPLELELADEMPRLHISLAITSATRSVMMFTIMYRVTLANRSDKAVRDITLSAKLASAQKGISNGASLAAALPIGTIDRIGPQQSHTITATMQLPMVEVRAIRQGSTPVFIPLLHITIEGAGQRATSASFVIGTPSEASQLRLHPIALDTPPGSIRGLRANEIRAPLVGENA